MEKVYTREMTDAEFENDYSSDSLYLMEEYKQIFKDEYPNETMTSGSDSIDDNGDGTWSYEITIRY